MIGLAALLALNAVLHAVLVARFGVKGNEPFLAYVFVYGALAVAVFSGVPFALWATLVMAVLGIVGLTVTFNKANRGKSLDKVIWGLDAAAIVFAAWLAFAG